MEETSAQPLPGAPDEAALRAELARGDVVLATSTPVLRQLLATQRPRLFSDEVLARVGGMVADSANQLISALPDGASDARDAGLEEDIAASLAGHSGILAHFHALALEWQLAESLQHRLGIDPVLSPLLQALIASPDADTASTAMALLAAQTRFVQQQRRMRIALRELPGDLFHAALLVLRGHSRDETQTAEAERRLRQDFDEGGSRLGLLARLVTGMGNGSAAALGISHAGAALFVTALSLASGQDRETVVLASAEGQFVRLALSLRASGLRPREVIEQVLAICPEAALPAGIEQVSPDRAAALLAHVSSWNGA